MYINDTGDSSWEEINAGRAGADYGWNLREGHCRAGAKADCGPAPRGMTNPVFDYRHKGGCGALTGGAFVPSNWPQPYRNGYLYADYLCGKVGLLRPGSTRATNFATGLGHVIDLVLAPTTAARRSSTRAGTAAPDGRYG